MEEEKKYYLSDLETGYKYEVTKEYYERFMRDWDEMMANINKEYKGHPIIVGTMGGFENQDNLQEMFFNPESFKYLNTYNKLNKYFMPNTPEFVFTPGQREEALAWLKENCNGLYIHIEEALTGYEADMIIDMYFKLKSSTFELKPTEFIVGIEYKDQQAIINGEEKVNISIHNPDRKVKHNQFAFEVMMEIIKRLKS